MHLSADMPTHPSVNLKGESPHSLPHFTQVCALPHHLSLLLTNIFERSLHMEGRQTPSTESTAGRELDDEAASFKTRAFLQKKELLEALMQEGMKEEEEVEGGGTVG